MAEPERSSTLISPARRKREQELLVRRSTTAVVGLAIILAGALTGLASAVSSAGRAGAQPAGSTGLGGPAALSKALADFEAAARRQAQAQAPAATQPVRPLAAPRSAPAPAPKPAAAVSGGS